MTFNSVFGGSTIYPAQPTYRAFALSANTTLQWPTESVTTGNIVAAINDVTPSGAGFVVRMPPANEASEGETALFFNVGASSFTVADNGGNTIVSLAPGQAWQVLVTDNSTVNGTWRSTQYGAGTSTATAGSLVGSGIKAIGTTLNQSMSATGLNSNYSIGDADRSEVFNWIGGAGTLTLPSAATVGNDWFIHTRNSGTGGVTIATSVGGQNINGGASIILNPGDSAIVFCDGSNFFTIGLGRSAAFAFDFVSIDLTGQPSPYILSGANLNRIAYRFTGTITSNVQVVVPNTVQQYWVTNSTSLASDPYSIEIKTLSGLGVTIARNQRAIMYCDGTDVIDADSAGISLPLSIAQGGTGATNNSAARINLGATATGNSLFTAASASAGRSTLGAGVIGDALFTEATAAGARTTIGAAASGAATGSGITMATARILGRTTASTGAIEEITVGTGLSLSGGSLTSTVTGTVTSVNVSGGTTGLTTSGGPVTGSGTITLAGTLAIANGGTGQTTATAGFDALAGVTSTVFGRATNAWADAAAGRSALGLGSLALLNTINNSNWSGTALAIANGGTGQTTATAGFDALSGVTSTVFGRARLADADAAATRSALGVSATGADTTYAFRANNLSDLANAATARTNLGAAASGAVGSSGVTMSTARMLGRTTAGTGAIEEITIGSGLSLSAGTLVATASGGSVTSVSGTGSVNGITLSGTVTTAGNITLGGALSGVDLTSQITGTLPIANGGTGVTTAPANGRLLIGNGTGYTVANLTAGTGISITNGAGSITIASTVGGGTVTSVSVDGGTTGLTFSGNPVTTSGTITMAGTLAVANGGTGATTAANARTNLGATATGSALFTAASAAAARGTLGATTVGENIFTLTNPGAVTFLTINADNTVSARSAALYRGDLGLGSAAVINVPVTVGNGGTGATTLTANQLLRGNGTGAVLASTVFDNGTNVGIGTTSPSSRLSVIGDIQLSRSLTASDAAINFGSTTDNFIFGGNSSNVMTFAVNGAERMQIASTGNVGIGATSPAERLDVNGVARAISFRTENDHLLYSVSATAIGFRVGASGPFYAFRNTSGSNMVIDSSSGGDVALAVSGTQVLSLTSTGALTSTARADAVGFKGAPQVSRTASFSLALTDIGLDQYISGTTAGQTATIPANASVAFPIGTIIPITNDSNQNWSIAITSDTLFWSPSGGTGTRTLAAGGQCTIKKVTATRWWISGVGLS